MANRPILMLDVDGVLAPFGPEAPEGYELHNFNFGIGTLDVLLSAANKDRLKRMQRVCDLMWATAWEDHANDMLLEHLGLEDPLPLIYYDHRLENEGKAPEIEGARKRIRGINLLPGVETWKLPWIRQWAAINEGRPFAWIDDDIKADAFAWAEERMNKGTPTLMVQTDPLVGFTEEHADQIEEWAKGIDHA